MTSSRHGLLYCPIVGFGIIFLNNVKGLNRTFAFKRILTAETSNGGENLKGRVLFDIGFFAYNETSKFMELNKEGTLTYQETAVDEEDKSFAMNGTITIIDQPFSSDLSSAFPNQNTSSNYKIETVGAYVLAAMEMEKYISKFTSKGFVIDTMHTIEQGQVSRHS